LLLLSFQLRFTLLYAVAVTVKFDGLAGNNDGEIVTLSTKALLGITVRFEIPAAAPINIH